MTLKIAIGPARQRFENGEALWRIAADLGTTRQTLAKRLRAEGVDTAPKASQRLRRAKALRRNRALALRFPQSSGWHA